MADVVSMDHFYAWLEAFRDVVHEQSGYLTELDSAIGDADHGTNLTRGMDAVMTAVDGDERPGDVAALFSKVGMTLVSSVGGASGPLYGTFFLRLGTTAGAVTELDGDGLVQALQAALGGVVARGRPEAGDKTMFDALQPAVAALESGVAEGRSLADSLRSAAEAAAQGRDATRDMLARKGRASYLGERSVGHIDPGAASSALMVATLAEAAG